MTTKNFEQITNLVYFYWRFYFEIFLISWIFQNL